MEESLQEMTKSKISTFDPVASEYDSWFERKGKLIFAIETRALQQAMSASPTPWLEIGVGSGRFAQSLGIENGLDPSSEFLNMARNRGVNAFLGRGEAIPFKNNAFGAVFLIVTLCFVALPLKVLLEAHRILNKQGEMVLGLVLRESPWGKLYELKKERGHYLYEHAAFYNYSDVEILLKQAGFSIDRVISTLFQEPDKVKHMEFPQEGFSPDAGFTVIRAKKN